MQHAEARARFLSPLRRHLPEAGLNHISEIVAAEPPHTSRGCPFLNAEDVCQFNFGDPLPFGAAQIREAQVRFAKMHTR
jgi:hypothetical protein